MLKIEGPYAAQDVDGLKTPVYIYDLYGQRRDIGEAKVNISNGLIFEVTLVPAYQHATVMAVVDVPMRFAILNQQET